MYGDMSLKFGVGRWPVTSNIVQVKLDSRTGERCILISFDVVHLCYFDLGF